MNSCFFDKFIVLETPTIFLSYYFYQQFTNLFLFCCCNTQLVYEYLIFTCWNMCDELDLSPPLPFAC